MRHDIVKHHLSQRQRGRALTTADDGFVGLSERLLHGGFPLCGSPLYFPSPVQRTTPQRWSHTLHVLPDHDSEAVVHTTSKGNQCDHTTGCRSGYSSTRVGYSDSLPEVRSVIEATDNCKGDFSNANEAPNNPRHRKSNTTE